MTFDQSGFDVRCEWGENGVQRLAPGADVVVIVDVLSFSTCVEVANSRGAIVFPYRWKDESAAAFAASVNAELASVRRAGGGYSLSPASLMSATHRLRSSLQSMQPRCQFSLPVSESKSLTTTIHCHSSSPRTPAGVNITASSYSARKLRCRRSYVRSLSVSVQR